jgi:uncharacterized protein
VACPQHQQGHEIDAVVMQVSAGSSDRVLAIGEAKAAANPIDEPELARLDHLRTLLALDRRSPAPKLLLFSRGGRHASPARRGRPTRRRAY